MARSKFRLALLALGALVLLSEPAPAQFEWLFGRPPPRPPADVPGGRPQVLDRDDIEPDALPPPGPRQRGVFPSDARRPGRIDAQPLPPPPSARGQMPQQAHPAQPPAQLPPGQPPPQAQPGQGPLFGLPPGQRQPRNGPQQAVTEPQPGDVTVTEMPAQKIANKSAVFSGLDKITGRIITFDVAIDETVQFGALQVTPKVCFTRPPTETPNTDGFVQVDEVTLQGEVRRIFSGWMFASSPGLHAVEHPIYDIWLTDCKDPTTNVAGVETPQPAEPAKPPRPQPQRRPRR